MKLGALSRFWKVRFERNTDERVALLILCPLLSAFCLVVLLGLDPLLERESLDLGRWLLHEAMYTCLACLALGFLWATFRPRWMERSLVRAAEHVRFLICAALLFFFVLCPIVTLVVELIRSNG